MDTIRVLIVDDDEVSRLVVGRALQEVGHEVAYAPEGEAALTLMRKRPFDLVITDLAMPGLNGLRLIREIRDLGDHVPIIAISGVNADQLLMAEDYGANVTLFKPIDREILLQLVEKLDRQEAKYQENIWL